MVVCKCTVPLRHGGTLNSRRAANHRVRLVEREERLGPLTIPWGPTPLSKNWDGIEQNRSVNYMVLKAKANDRRKNLTLRNYKFRGP
ncbi:uncharacterized protein TNCV_2895121 [Trichonephila clavipes]|nr:uncharacterized protein TNCV_2895121 [Trichonephila clavipes]